ncbi:restriction endonuclease subunit S [Yersinia enterocolitica]|uniref:restriction endonuclease subunit S n=1 Tax=Yersinia enterocolitica TaxID=630 RepID=UPI00094BAEC5|nr:restriction endonuclease subunit S [Yersinia enterocolitica]
MSMDSKVPEIRFKGFSGEWVENNLGELIDIRSAARVHKEQWTEAGVPFFRTSDVVSIYKGQENTKAYISHEVYNGLSEKIGKVTKDDLLITGGGSIGIPYLVQNDNPLYFKDADLLWLKNNKKFNGYFLYTFFFSAPFKRHIKSISHTGTIAHYTIEQVKATPINTCYDEEQTQIGNCFQKLDTLINQHQQKHDKLSSIKKAMLEKMFPKQSETIPEIRFKGFSGEWEEKLLGEMVTCFSGGTPVVGVEEYYKGNIPFIRSAEINKATTELTISESGLKNSSAKLVELGTVLYALYGATSGEVGRARICGAINQAILAIVPKAKICPEFLTQWLRKNKGNIVNTYLQGGQGNLSGQIVKNLILNLPGFEEQTAIGNYFQKLDALINQHQQQITKLNNIKQACLSKMFV